MCVHSLERSQSVWHSSYTEIRELTLLFFPLFLFLFLPFLAATVAPNSAPGFFKSVKLKAPMIQPEGCLQAKTIKWEIHLLSSSSKYSLQCQPEKKNITDQPLLGCFPFLYFVQSLWFYLFKGLSERAIG